MEDIILETVIKFDIQYHQFLDPDGQLIADLPKPFSSTQELVEIYRSMLRNRLFDTKAVALQRTGKLGTFPASEGQEATLAGIGWAMKPEDVLVPSYREHGALFNRGVTMKDVLLYWGGDERGSDYTGSKEDFPPSVPIASQTTHAVGAATAFKLRNEKRVAVTVCGDGGSSRADFYEGINFAGVWKSPMVSVVINNQWAISVPREKQSACETIAQKAFAAGIPGVQVDGNDIIAVMHVMTEALERARNGEGPTLIEAITYRLCDHTTADDAKRYRSNEEVAHARNKDPIKRLKTFLIKENLWTEEDDAAAVETITAEVNAAAKAYEETPPQSIDSMFDYMYETWPENLQEQKDIARSRSAL